MVSLGSVEQYAKQFDIENEHAAVIYNNPNGKEEVILFSTNKEFDISQFKTFLVSNGQSPRLSLKRYYS